MVPANLRLRRQSRQPRPPPRRRLPHHRRPRTHRQRDSTWDDWGGFDDHVATPNVEITPDGVQLAYGPRVPLLMFGGRVKPGIDHRWSWHPSIPKTVIDLLKLPKLGVPRVDGDHGLADLVDLSAGAKLNPPPPAHGTSITQPTPPKPTPTPTPVPPPPVAKPAPVGPILLRGGGTLPPPNDVPLTTKS
ncbi:alkaline phosphatase family protein [Streptomyces sp. AA4]|uniref:alkaline phosphatase family protein n=1 Tax=Streptomyces sp. AA4 TaxID=591158 RepID=UPI002570C4AE|nr:alkaline phosphatase family protein [Streptomyces sp. AA4]